MLFVPGGVYVGSFRPVVVMAQSVLQFGDNPKLYKWTLTYLKIIVKRFFIVKTFENANGIIYVSKYCKELITAQYKQLKTKTSTIIYHGVNPKFYVERREKKDDKLTKSFLFVGAVCRHKNVYNLSKAIIELYEEGYNIELKIVGPIQDKKIYKSVKKLDPEGHIIKFIGEVDYNYVQEYYKVADYFIIPSLFESFGLPLLEAYESKLKILCSRIEVFEENSLEDISFFMPNMIDIRLKIKEELLNSIARQISISELNSWIQSTNLLITFLRKINNYVGKNKRN